MRKLLAILLTTLVAGCTPATAPHPVLEPAPSGLDAEELVAAVWTAKPQVLRLRQTARFRFRGREVPMVGMMELDTRNGTARLVAVNEMGIKLFDLSVTEDVVRDHYVLPELARYPQFSEAVATSLRRIFLDPRPQRADAIRHDEMNGYRLNGERDGQTMTFLFGGDPVRLVEKRATGRRGDWRAVYLNYRKTAALDYPQDIVLEDRRADYRLDLRIESVKRHDEPNQQ